MGIGSHGNRWFSDRGSGYHVNEHVFRPASHRANATSRRKGKVWLVGAGPGDPELLTIKAARLIRTADVILHDALVPQAILALASPSAQLLDVGKRCGRKNVTQPEINRMLIEFSSLGQFVVRLKSGDPFIFGRAGEELQAVREAGIETEVVPGITLAVAAAAVAQVPLTDRRHADRVVLLSAHRAEGKEKEIDWQAISGARTTLVVYMPGEYAHIKERLIGIGFRAETPCLVMSRISSAEEHHCRTTLEHLNAASGASPSIVIIGDVVGKSTRTDIPFVNELAD